MNVYVVNFVHGRRGPSSTVMVRNDSGDIAFGTVFYNEVGGESVLTGVAAIEWCEQHAQEIWDGLLVSEDDGIYPGWTKNPHTELQMLDRAKKLAGWE